MISLFLLCVLGGVRCAVPVPFIKPSFFAIVCDVIQNYISTTMTTVPRTLFTMLDRPNGRLFNCNKMNSVRTTMENRYTHKHTQTVYHINRCVNSARMTRPIYTMYRANQTGFIFHFFFFSLFSPHSSFERFYADVFLCTFER